MDENLLLYGDNLDFLRDQDLLPTGSVDLVYLDPPFNSNATYNVLFRDASGVPSAAQIKAFDDTWTWDSKAQEALGLLMGDKHASAELGVLIKTLHSFLGHSPMLAYLVQMAIRLVHLHRVLRQTGALYLHCDPTASHYLKLILDALFGRKNFRREVIWRSGWVSGFKGRASNWTRNHDVLLYYLRDIDAGFTFNKDLAYTPHPEGYQRRGGGENTKGVPIDDVWDENELYSPWIKSFSKEKLGYMTQKPASLLKRIIRVCSRPGDVVLDPFCGCGTTIDAVEQLNREEDGEPRRWIGIDLTHLSINLIKYRLARFDPPAKYEVRGEPRDLGGARQLFADDRYQFQYWACGLVAARPAGSSAAEPKKGKKGADKGIDGVRLFEDDRTGPKTILVQVKGGAVGAAAIRDFRGTIERESAALGLFITLNEPTKPMRSEAASAGTYPTDGGPNAVPRLQIVTVEMLLSGGTPRQPAGVALPPGADVDRTFQRAERHDAGALFVEARKRKK